MSPLRGEKPQNRPVSNRNTGRAALRADPAGKDAVILRMELRRGAHLPFPGHWARRWIYHWVCDAWPVRRQTCSLVTFPLSSQWPVAIYTAWWTEAHCVWSTCPESLREVERPGLEPATSRLRVRRPNHYATRTPHQAWLNGWLTMWFCKRNFPGSTKRPEIQTVCMRRKCATRIDRNGLFWHNFDLLSEDLEYISTSTTAYRLQDCHLGIPVSDRPGTCLSGRRLSARCWYQCSPTPLSRHGKVRCPSHVQQLRRPVLCSCRTTSVEHVTTQLKTVW